MPDRFEIMPTTCPNHPTKGQPVYFFITLVNFPPGKTALGFMNAVKEADKELKPTRHERGIYEEDTFVTLGRYDMVMTWHAPDLSTMARYWEALHEKCGADLGTTETLVATSKGAPKDQ